MTRGKKPSVRYWESRGGYCCWIAGVQQLLSKGPKDDPTGPTYLAALDRFRKLLALEQDKGTDDYLVSSLLNQYRIHLKATRKSAVPGVFEVMARGFAAEFGHKRVSELQPYMLERWLERQKQWNCTSKAHAGTLILSAVSWARKKGFIRTDPLAGRVDLPTPVLRGREARMSDELMDLLVDETYRNKMKSREFGDFLKVLRATGARPGEIRNAEAFNYQKVGGKGRLVFRWNAAVGYTHKTASKTQRDRIIYFTDEITRMVDQLALQHPTGALFRTPRGAKWSATSVANKWRWLVKRPRVIAYCKGQGIDANSLKPYFFRHSLISHYLDATADIYGIAQMCGTSVKMISTRYGHPDTEKLHDKFLAFHATKDQAQELRLVRG